MRDRVRVGGSGVLAALTVVAALGAQARPPQTPQAPTFRGSTDIVAVDFLAIDADGKPIGNLTPADFKLTVDGKPREIRSLQFLEVAPPTTPPKGSLPRAKAVPAPFGSNAPRDAGRIVIILFHHTSIMQGDERLTRDAIQRFLDTLTARDRVALITFPQGEIVSDLTTDHDRIRKALPTLTGHAPQAGINTPGFADTTSQHVLLDLATIINGFASIDGPKTVILVTQGVPALTNNNAQEFADIGKAASRSRSQFFIIEPYTFGAMSGTVHYAVDAGGNADHGAQSRVGGGIEDLAGATGGELFSPSGTADAILERVARESSAYYLLGFEPTAGEINGKSHKIGLSVSRPGVTIRARPDFVIDKPAAPAKPTAGAPPGPAMLLRDALSHTDLPLFGVGYAFRAPAKNQTKVLAVVQSPAGVKLSAAAFALYDAKGRVAAQWSADAQDLAMSPVVSAMSLPAGTYRLRMAAAEESGRMGAVDYEINTAVVPVADLSAGSLMAGIITDKQFQPRFAFAAAEKSATAYTELYGTDGGRAVVRFELATTSDGPPLQTIPGTISPTKDPDRWIVTGAIPLAGIAPGDIVVRAIVTSGGKTGTIVRTLRRLGS